MTGRARALAALVAILALWATIMPPWARAEQPRRVTIVIVVGAGSDVHDISQRELALLFSGRRQAGHLIPINRPARSPLRVAFDRAVLDMGADEVARYWIDREVRGQSGVPRSFSSPLTVAKLVARFPRAIGYLEAQELPAYVRAVRVDGLPHTDPRYPLHLVVTP